MFSSTEKHKINRSHSVFHRVDILKTYSVVYAIEEIALVPLILIFIQIDASNFEMS